MNSTPRTKSFPNGRTGKARGKRRPPVARLFNQNLEVIWDSCEDRTIRLPLFHDAQGNVVGIPPPGKDRNDWPVQQVISHGKPLTKEYSVSINESQPPHRFIVRAYQLAKSGSVPLIVEETEQVFPRESQKDVLEKLDAQVNGLILGMVDRLSEEIGASALSLRFPNPNLQPCYETHQCQQEDCPAYEAGKVRCWEVNPGFSPDGSRVAGDAKCHGARCDKCDMFLQACRNQDPLTRICERVNRLLHVLQQKHQEAIECYRQVQQAEKLAALGELTTGIAHEIKTPLSIIMGRLDCLSLEIDTLSPSELAQDLDVIRVHALRMRSVLDEFLNLARPRAAQIQCISVDDLMKPALEVLSKTLEERHIRMSLKLPQQTVMVHADPLQVRQVLLNIILNARDAMAEGGDLTITSEVRTGAGSVAIEISDTGEGISSENMERIFSPFFTTKMERGGTGLGLMVCKRIMSRHGGAIEVKSEPGIGSTFTLVFPESHDL